MQTATSVSVPSPVEWMRIFACRLAQARPELGAQDIVNTAVQEFRCRQSLPPEIAVEQCVHFGRNG